MRTPGIMSAGGAIFYCGAKPADQSFHPKSADCSNVPMAASFVAAPGCATQPFRAAER